MEQDLRWHQVEAVEGGQLWVQMLWFVALLGVELLQVLPVPVRQA